VALGPVQRAVLDIVLELTQGGRRPSLTLARLSALTGRPVSSVHDAIGRLRALGLIGAVARMGRIGGIRFWRVSKRSEIRLDNGRHRLAIARIAGRFHKLLRDVSVAAQGSREAPGTRPLWDGAHPSDRASGDPAPESSGAASGPAAPADPPASEDSGKPWYDRTPETFHEKMRRHGIGDWIGDRTGKPRI